MKQFQSTAKFKSVTTLPLIQLRNKKESGRWELGSCKTIHSNFSLKITPNKNKFFEFDANNSVKKSDLMNYDNNFRFI